MVTNKGITPNKKTPLHLLQLVLNTQTSKELLPSLIPEMPKPKGAAGSKS